MNLRKIKKVIYTILFPSWRKGNEFYLNGATLSLNNSKIEKCYFEFDPSNKMVINNSTLKNCRFVISGNHSTIIIEEGCNFHDMDVWIEDGDCIVHFSKNVQIFGNKNNNTGFSCIEGSKIFVGENCLISSGVVFTTGDGHSLLDMDGKRTNYSKDIIIGNHVWIGRRVMISKGVTLSDETVVGAGAIVTKSFNQSNCVIAGVPGKIVKENVRWRAARIK